VNCPRCGGTLLGLGTYCWTCRGYVQDLAATTQKPTTTEPEDARLEKAVQEAVALEFRVRGFKVWWLSQPRATMQSGGLADLYVTGRGLCIWVEVKRRHRRSQQSAEQLEFMKAVLENGGLIRVVRHESEVHGLIEDLSFGR
jgi:hypothetical protein